MSTTERYADAIVALARAEDALDTVEDELLAVARALASDEQLGQDLTGAAMPPSRQLELLENEALAAAHPATRTALATLITAGRLNELQAIATAVAERAAAERGRELAEVAVAVPLDEGRREQLRHALEAATGKDLDVKVFVDEDLVGGVRARIGDRVIDGSLARRLADVHTRFTT